MRAAAVTSRVRAARPRRVTTLRRVADPIVRAATFANARAVHALIVSHVSEGHLLPRSLEDVELHIGRFVVAVDRGRIVACVDLAPLSPSVAEVRSLVVGAIARERGLGRRLLNELVHRARAAGFQSLCAFTHAAAYFVRLGFSIVPHPWVPEKIEADCRSCPQFRHCGQYAVTFPLSQTAQSFVPLASLHG